MDQEMDERPIDVIEDYFNGVKGFSKLNSLKLLPRR
jgi:hypothetical protein